MVIMSTLPNNHGNQNDNTAPRSRESSRKRRRKKVQRTVVEKNDDEDDEDDENIAETVITVINSTSSPQNTIPGGDQSVLRNATELGGFTSEDGARSADNVPRQRTRRKVRSTRKTQQRGGREEVELKVRNSRSNDDGTHFRMPRDRGSMKKRRRETIGHTYEHYDHDEEFNAKYNLDLSDILEPADLQHSSARFIGGHTMPQLRSEETNVVYIQKRGATGFMNEDKTKLIRSCETEQPEHMIVVEKGALHFVLRMQQYFHGFSLMVHGLLAGLALSHFFFVMVLSSKGDMILLEMYQDLALPYHCLYYFLLAISNVSIFERYVNTSNGWRHFFLTLLRKPSRAFALIFYIFALILSTGLFQLDNRISMYPYHKDLWKTNAKEHLALWKIINLLRVVGSVLGWAMVCMAPNHNETSAGIEETLRKGSNIGEVRSSVSNGRTSVLHNSASIVRWDGIK